MDDTFEYVEYTPRYLSVQDVKNEITSLNESLNDAMNLLVLTERIDESYTLPVIENVIDGAYNTIVIKQVIPLYKSMNSKYGNVISKQIETTLGTIAYLLAAAKNSEIIDEAYTVAGRFVHHPVFEKLAKCINDIKNPQNWHLSMDMKRRKPSKKRSLKRKSKSKRTSKRN